MSGALSSLFSGAVIPPQPTGSDSTSTTPLWYQDLQYNIGNAAANLATQPYTPYTGQQVATPSAATQQAWNMATGSVGNYQPDLNTAQDLTSTGSNLTSGALNYVGQGSGLTNAATGMAVGAAQPIGAQQINQYMNPYTNSVVGALQQASNYNLINNQLPAISSQFVGAGQAASPQMAQADNNALYLSNQALDQATAGALQSGYQSATGTALAEQQAQQAGASQLNQFGQSQAGYGALQNQIGAQQGAYGAQYGQLGALTQQLGAAQTGLVASAGQAQDTVNQQNLNVAQNNFNAQQQWPYQNLAYASNITNGLNVPSNTQTVGMQYSPTASYTASPLASFVGTTLGATALQNGTTTNSNGALSTYARGGRIRPRRIAARRAA